MDFVDVVERMINEKRNPLYLDPWVPADTEAFKCVKNTFTDDNNLVIRSIKVEDFEFMINYTDGGGVGMGEYPPRITLYCLVNFENYKRKRNTK